LKGKSRRKKGSQSPVKAEHLGRISDELDVQERTQTQGRRSRLRKGSLKESRSVPRNLRFSGDHSGECSTNAQNRRRDDLAL
jgi:hypothetical protein